MDERTAYGLFAELVTQLLSCFYKRRTLKRYLTLLPRRLREDYGHMGPYTPAQVEAAIRRHKVSSRRYLAHALTIFCDRSQVERLWRERGDQNDFDKLRSELGGAYFSGDTAFTLLDVARFSTGHELSRAPGGHETHGVAHHGGDAGGGHP